MDSKLELLLNRKNKPEDKCEPISTRQPLVEFISCEGESRAVIAELTIKLNRANGVINKLEGDSDKIREIIADDFTATKSAKLNMIEDIVLSRG